MNDTNFEVMATFSHPLRVRLMQLLSQRKMTVQELAEKLPISAGGIRPHIGYFADRKLLHTERRGRSVRYWLNRERLAEALADFGESAGLDVRMVRGWKVEEPRQGTKKAAKKRGKTSKRKTSKRKTSKRKTSKRKTSKSGASRTKSRKRASKTRSRRTRGRKARG